MPPFLLFLLGLAAGAGAAMVAPVLAPQATRNLRPVLRAGLKLAITAGGAVRAAAAETAETLEDVYAEAQAELNEAPAAPAAPATPVERGSRTRRGAKATAARTRAAPRPRADA